MRYYSSSAVQTSLSANISSSATTINVASVAGFPIQYPFTLSVDADNANKELVEVTDAVGTSLTVVRGVDSTASVAHSMGAAVSHDHSARDFRESRDHEAATAAHGASGAVVGTTNTQTLTNKNLTSGTNVFPSSLTTDTELTAGLATKANASHTHPLTDITGTSGLATLTGAQTLTNKDLTAGTNTFPAASFIPTGVVFPFFGTAAPSGWLLIDGVARSRTTYAALYAQLVAAVPSVAASGDGSTTFVIPGKGRSFVGLDAGVTEVNALGKTGGETEHALTIGEMPSHQHGGYTGSMNNSANLSMGDQVTTSISSPRPMARGGGSFANLVVNDLDHLHYINPEGNNQAHNNMHPYVVSNYIVKT